MPTSPATIRALLRLAICAIALAVPSAAFADCGHEIIDQAYKGKITKHYSQACYNTAIRIEPVDGSSYSDIDSIIRDAKRADALRGPGRGRRLDADGQPARRPRTQSGSPRRAPTPTTSRDAVSSARRPTRRTGRRWAHARRRSRRRSRTRQTTSTSPDDDRARRAVGDAGARSPRPGARRRRARRRDRARRARRACSCSPASPVRSSGAAAPAPTTLSHPAPDRTAARFSRSVRRPCHHPWRGGHRRHARSSGNAWGRDRPQRAACDLWCRA